MMIYSLVMTHVPIENGQLCEFSHETWRFSIAILHLLMNLGKLLRPHCDRTLGIIGFYREIMPFHGRTIQASEILQLTQMNLLGTGI